MENNNLRIAKNTVFLAIRMVIVVCITLYTSRVILSVLGVTDYGIYNVVAGFVSMFAFLNNAMTTGVQRFYNYELGKNGLDGAHNVFNTSIWTQLVLGILIVLITESVGLWYINNKMVIPSERFGPALWIFHFSVCSLFINIMSVPFMAAIMSHERMGMYAYISIFDAIAKLIIALCLPLFSIDRLISYGFFLLLVTVLIFSVNACYAWYNFSEVRIRRVFHKELFRDLLAFSGWNVFGKFAIVMKGQGLNMILNLFFGPVVNAARGVAYQVNSALNGFVSTVTIAVKPQMTQSYAQGNIDRTFNLMFSISKLCYLVLLILAVPLCLELDYVLHLWLGENIPEYTGIFIILIVMSTFVNNLNAPVSFVVHATGKMKRYQIITSSIELLMIPASFIILKLGAQPWIVFVVEFVFVVIGQIASVIILNGLISFSIRNYLTEVVLPLVFPTVISCLVGFCFRSLFHEGFLRLIGVIGVTFVTTVLISYFCVLTRIEKEILHKSIKSLRSNSLT